MNLKYSYWYFQSALPVHFCNKIIAYGNSKKEQLGITGGLTRIKDKKIETEKDLNEEELNNLQKRRNSNVVWLDEKWIYRYLHYYLNVANISAGWNFQWDQSENIQFTKYKLNQFYDWHCDSWKEPYGEDQPPYLKGKIRKLSMTCCLSDPKDYKGGEFEFRFTDDEGKNVDKVCKEIIPRGSIVVFPSHIHQLDTL